MVSQAGTLTYRARSDGSPYSVINQARGTYTKLPAAGQVISQGHVLYRVERQPGGVAAWLDTRLSDPVGRGDRPRRGRAQRGSGRARLCHPSSAQPKVRLLRAGDHHGRGEAAGRPGGDPERHADSWPGGVRTHRRAGDEPCQPSSGAAPGRRDGDAGHLDHSPGAGGVDASQQTDVAVGDKVSITLPNNRTTPGVVSSVGAVATCPSSSGSGGSGSSSAAPGTDTCSSGSSGSSHTDHHRRRHPV